MKEGERAVEALGEVGSETALVKLLEFTFSETQLAELLYHQSVPHVAINKIYDRIGETRFLAVVKKYIRDSRNDARVRVIVAMVPFGYEFRDFNKSREITEAKETAIATLSELLDSEDEAASLRAADGQISRSYPRHALRARLRRHRSPRVPAPGP